MDKINERNQLQKFRKNVVTTILVTHFLYTGIVNLYNNKFSDEPIVSNDVDIDVNLTPNSLKFLKAFNKLILERKQLKRNEFTYVNSAASEFKMPNTDPKFNRSNGNE